MSDTSYDDGREGEVRDDRRPGNPAEALRLRPMPPRVTRLSRKVLAGLGVAAGLGIGAALIFGLQGRDGGNATTELFTTENQPTADGLRRLPSDYSDVPRDVPKLGPALPGDLGRPIVRAREEGRPVPAQPMPGPDPEEQRRLQEQEAARTSELFFSAGTKTAVPGMSRIGQTPAGPGGPYDNDGTSSQDRHGAFLNGPVDRRTVSGGQLVPPASPYVLQAGAVIPAALITGIRSDLPGQITAQVTSHVYDSPSGRYLLLPQGTRLIGQYDSGVAFGQRRVLLVWNRLILPNGRSIVLERQPGADALGFAGLEDGVDYHWWDLAKAAALSTLLGVGAELGADEEDRLIAAIRGGAQGTVNDAGQQIVKRQLDVEPTLTIRPGFPVRVIVTRDLILEPYGAL
ncbi:MAG TPA: TrbI/VirB10 family protein [Aurantimonas coralicida]|uniref:Conjugal transfer protein TraI n=2 Tax=root TaxID=1 RepID=A0A0F9WNE2_9ZZZZ|nr:TrbI/VirB10 family protein [Aurantimonas coralicida]